MFCTACGNSIGETDRFCPQCGRSNAPGAGAPLPPPPPSFQPSGNYRLARDMRQNKMAGVCAGLARYLGWDVTLVRVAFVVLLFLHGVSLAAYLILWLVMPRDDRPPFVQVQPQT